MSRAAALPGIGGTVLEVRHGGAWLIGVDGTQAWVLNAPNRELLTTLAGRGELAGGARTGLPALAG